MSFRRIKPSANPPPPPGTILSPTVPSLPHLSTGLASLDDVLAPGQPLSSTLLVLTPDTHTAWSKLLARYWLSAGLLAAQDVVLVGGPGEPDELVQGSMWIEQKNGGTLKQQQEEVESEGEDVLGEDEAGRTRIAWRYANMSKFQTTVDSTTDRNAFAYNLSLTHTIPSAAISAALAAKQLSYMTVDPVQSSRKGKGRATSLDNLIEELRSLASRPEYTLASTSSPSTAPRVLRIVLPNLFSYAYGPLTPEDMYRFLLALRSILRSSRAVALVTLPPHLCRDSTLCTRLSFASDGVLELEGFGSDPTLPLLFPSQHGLLSVPRPFSLHALAPPAHKLSTLQGASSSHNNLAFKLKRKAFVVQTLHLDIDGGVGERRTTPAPAATAAAHDHPHHHGEDTHVRMGQTIEEETRAGGKVRVEVAVAEQPSPAAGDAKKEEVKPRKSALKKKTVGFAVDPSKPELYDF